MTPKCVLFYSQISGNMGDIERDLEKNLKPHFILEELLLYLKKHFHYKTNLG